MHRHLHKEYKNGWEGLEDRGSESGRKGGRGEEGQVGPEIPMPYASGLALIVLSFVNI